MNTVTATGSVTGMAPNRRLNTGGCDAELMEAPAAHAFDSAADGSSKSAPPRQATMTAPASASGPCATCWGTPAGRCRRWGPTSMSLASTPARWTWPMPSRITWPSPAPWLTPQRWSSADAPPAPCSASTSGQLGDRRCSTAFGYSPLPVDPPTLRRQCRAIASDNGSGRSQSRKALRRSNRAFTACLSSAVGGLFGARPRTELRSMPSIAAVVDQELSGRAVDCRLCWPGEDPVCWPIRVRSGLSFVLPRSAQCQCPPQVQSGDTGHSRTTVCRWSPPAWLVERRTNGPTWWGTLPIRDRG